MSARKIFKIITAHKQLEGAGFVVRRPFPSKCTDQIDPFLMLDHMGPVTYAPGKAVGAPDRTLTIFFCANTWADPHRGFETVTYLLKGSFQHKDSKGHSGTLTPGDVQWMTAGAGIVHSEMPSDEIMQKGGEIEGFQIWVNLPKQFKMTTPRYQDIPKHKIPEAEKDGVKVRVIAGSSMGKEAVIETKTPIMFLHVEMQAGSSFVQAVPHDFNAFAYMMKGTATFDQQQASESQCVIFDKQGDQVHIQANANVSFLLLGGKPLNEPVARYGPFVMNNQQELMVCVCKALY